MGDKKSEKKAKKEEEKLKEVRKKLREIQKILNNKDKIILSDNDINLIYILIVYMINNKKKLANQLIEELKRRKTQNEVQTIKKNISSERYDNDDILPDNNRISSKKAEEDVYNTLYREKQANDNIIREIEKKSKAEYEMFCIKEPVSFKYPENDSDDAEQYCNRFISGLTYLINDLKSLKREKSFETISKKLTECQFDFNDYFYDVLKGNKENISETAVKACFKYIRETVFESVIPILYSHIYDDYEENKDMYIDFLVKLNEFMESLGIFTCNEFTYSGKSLIGEKLISLNKEQRMFYITIPLASSEPEKNGIITAVEQLPYMTYYMTENGSLKRIVSKGKLIVIKSI